MYFVDSLQEMFPTIGAAAEVEKNNKEDKKNPWLVISCYVLVFSGFYVHLFSSKCLFEFVTLNSFRHNFMEISPFIGVNGVVGKRNT